MIRNLLERHWLSLGFSLVFLPCGWVGGGISLVRAQPLPTPVPTTAAILYVDPRMGNDTNDGTQASPYRTITRALAVAAPNTIVQLSQGSYTPETGERFPLQLHRGIRLQGSAGNRGLGVIIQGGGEFPSSFGTRENAAIWLGDRASVVGVTVSNPHGLGIWLDGSEIALEKNTIAGNESAGIVARRESRLKIAGNYIYDNGSGILLAGQVEGQVYDNIIDRNRVGIVVEGNARPVLRENSVEGSLEIGLLALDGARPDLGTRSQLGGNDFRRHRLHAIVNETQRAIAAWGNQIDGTTVGRVDRGVGITSSGIDTSVAAPSSSGEASSGGSSEPRSPLNYTPSPDSEPTLSDRTPRESPYNGNRAPRSAPGFVSQSNREESPLDVTSAADAPAQSPGMELVRRSTSAAEMGIETLPTPATPPDPTLRRSLEEILVLQPNISVSIDPAPSFNARGFTPVRPPLEQQSYKILVEVASPNDVERVRRLVPEAFASTYQKRPVMQIGIFSSLENAEAIRQQLIGQGLKVLVIPL